MRSAPPDRAEATASFEPAGDRQPSRDAHGVTRGGQRAEALRHLQRRPVPVRALHGQRFGPAFPIRRHRRRRPLRGREVKRLDAGASRDAEVLLGIVPTSCYSGIRVDRGVRHNTIANRRDGVAETSDMERRPAFRIKAQLMCGDEPAVGPGKALVLEAIDRAGSISAAGREIGMSYRRIWLLVDSMNRCWSERLVDTKVGGGSTKGARLTPKGRAVLDAFRLLERDLRAAAEDPERRALSHGLLERPRRG